MNQYMVIFKARDEQHARSIMAQYIGLPLLDLVDLKAANQWSARYQTAEDDTRILNNWMGEAPESDDMPFPLGSLLYWQKDKELMEV